MAEKKKRSKRKILLYVFLGTLLLGAIGIFGGIHYLKAVVFADCPNTLSFEGELHPVAFQWREQQFDKHVEPHAAILIPITVPGEERTLYMQFDTGSPSTFLNSGPLESLKERGIEFELFEDEDDERTRVRKFELDIGGNQVFLTNGWVSNDDAKIDWETPDSINIIGTIGADFIDQKVCEIDFPGQEIRLYESRPASIDALGSFTPFKFRGRRIMLPASLDGVEMELFYDSGCSAFGFLTSKYHFDRFADKDSKEISYNANRHGDPVYIHHKTCDAIVKFGDIELPIKRISYANLYAFLQNTIGRFVEGGFLGNKSLTESTLIIDAVSNEFLVVANSEDSSAKVDANSATQTSR